MANKFIFDSLEIFWLGHASFKIKGQGLLIYIDPYQVKQGERANLILITHDHYDHCDASSVKKIAGHETTILATSMSAEKLSGNIKTLSAGDEIEVKGAKIKAVPAYNITKPFHPRGAGIGFVIALNGKTIYHAGDTDKIPEMENLEKIDLALLPVGGTYTMDAAEAAEAVKMIKPEIAIPMHYGAGVVGSPEDAERFKELVGEISRVEILES